MSTLSPTVSFINPDFRIEAPLFGFSLQVSAQAKRFSLAGEERVCLVCPADTDFSLPSMQQWLHKVVGEALRSRALRYLPPRLAELAQKHGLWYKEVHIKSTRSRWGSCSSRGSINLSYYLMLLPEHLVDYVLLHELAHTREMNHGLRFWALLNSMTQGRALTLRKEMREYRTSY